MTVSALGGRPSLQLHSSGSRVLALLVLRACLTCEQDLWRFLIRRSLRPDSLRNLKFSVFGLGDSVYPR